jgi:hypothetical protein
MILAYQTLEIVGRIQKQSFFAHLNFPTHRPWSHQASPLEITLTLEDGKDSLENVILEIRIAAHKGNGQVNAYTIQANTANYNIVMT